jgi:hypothetical protein
MARLFTRLMFLFLPFAIGWLWLEWRLAQYPNSYQIKKTGLKRHKNSITCLIMGSSQSYWALNPNLMQIKAFNLANVSQSIDVDIALANQWLSSLPKLKFIVIPVSYFSLRTRLQDSNENWRLYFYLHEFGLQWPTIKSYTPRSWSRALLYSVPEALTSAYRKPPGPLPEKLGWLQVQHALDTFDLAAAKTRATLHTRLQQPELEDTLFAQLKQAIQSWQKQGIQTILVTLPVTKVYAAHLDAAYEHSNKQRIAELEALGAKYLNMSRGDTFTLDDFADFDHLNAAGASKASALLNNFLIKSDK